MIMNEWTSIYIYLAVVTGVTITVALLSGLFPSVKDSFAKFMPYESGIQTTTNLLKERFQLRHYLIGLIFLVFDVEVVFLYPWAAVAKEIGPFAFYEMLFFLVALLIGFAYVWKKGGLEWE